MKTPALHLSGYGVIDTETGDSIGLDFVYRDDDGKITETMIFNTWKDIPKNHAARARARLVAQAICRTLNTETADDIRQTFEMLSRMLDILYTMPSKQFSPSIELWSMTDDEYVMRDKDAKAGEPAYIRVVDGSFTEMFTEEEFTSVMTNTQPRIVIDDIEVKDVPSPSPTPNQNQQK